MWEYTQGTPSLPAKMVKIKQDVWGRCWEHLLGENKNTNTISLIHLRNGTYFICRHPHCSHESPHLLFPRQPWCLPALVSRYSFKNKKGGTASPVMTRENALKCSYKIQTCWKHSEETANPSQELFLPQDMAELPEYLCIKTFPL